MKGDADLSVLVENGFLRTCFHQNFTAEWMFRFNASSTEMIGQKMYQ